MLQSAKAERPGWIVSALCFLLVTGPPSFRARTAEAALRGDVDLVVVLQAAVYFAAFVWSARQLYLHSELRAFSWTHKVAALLVGLIAVSTFFSTAPLFTAYRAFQIAALFCFTTVFIKKFGVQTSLDRIRAGMLFLCLLLVIMAFLNPDQVLFVSETGFPRLRGWTIAESGTVSAFAVILLLCTPTARKRSWFWLSLSSGVLFFSLTRTAWISVFCVLLMIIVLRPQVWCRKVALIVLLAVLCTVMAVPALRNVRDESDVGEIGGRQYFWWGMIYMVLSDSPWFGEGYEAGTRTLAQAVDPTGGGQGHSAFLEVLVGTGIVGSAALCLLLGNLIALCLRFVKRQADAQTFEVMALFAVVLIIGSTWERLDCTPFGFTFWALVSIIPQMHLLKNQESAQRTSNKAIALSASKMGCELPAQ